ncbi:MAG: TrbC/VirB2 family protein [Chlorobium sp.]|nr:MAG: TrbC/VirB2 family protein [Chlorobium sp.]
MPSIGKLRKNEINKDVLIAAGIAFGILVLQLFPADAFADGAGLPWEDPLKKLLDSLTGPVSKVLGAVSIIGLGIGIAFSDGSSMMRKALWVVMGLAIAFSALSWGLTFMGFGGGLLV